MTHRDYLWCALNLLLDEEEVLSTFCPRCRDRAEAGSCPACGREAVGVTMGENTGFDMARFERMRRGEEA